VKALSDWAHALMVNDLARREEQPGTVVAVEYTYQYFSRRRYADLVRFGEDNLTVYEAKTEVLDLGETVRGLRDAGHILPLHEVNFKYRTFSRIDTRLVLLATLQNAEVVIDNLDMLTAVFGNGQAPGPDGVFYGLSLLDPLDEENYPVKLIPIGHLSPGRLGTLLGRLTPYRDKRDLERAYWSQRRGGEAAVARSQPVAAT